MLDCTCDNGGIALPPLDRKTLNQPRDDSWKNTRNPLWTVKNEVNCQNFIFPVVFFMYCPPRQPLLLLMDGHSSHYYPDVITAAPQEKVVVFTYLLTQPLDVGCFSPLKSCWKQVCHNVYKHNPGRVVSHPFGEAWMLALSQKHQSWVL